VQTRRRFLFRRFLFAPAFSRPAFFFFLLSAKVGASFDLNFMLSMVFAYKVVVLTAASTLPVTIGKACAQHCAPRVVSKLA